MDNNLAAAVPGLALRFSADADLLEVDAPEENPVAKLFSGISAETQDFLSKQAWPKDRFIEQGDTPLAKRQGDGDGWDEHMSRPVSGGGGDPLEKAARTEEVEGALGTFVREFDIAGELTAIYLKES